MKFDLGSYRMPLEVAHSQALIVGKSAFERVVTSMNTRSVFNLARLQQAFERLDTQKIWDSRNQRSFKQ